VQDLIAGKRHRQTPITTTRRTRHPYQLRGLLFCGVCRRRMQGSWNNDKPTTAASTPPSTAWPTTPNIPAASTSGKS
jgi:hypothetical protein